MDTEGLTELIHFPTELQVAATEVLNNRNSVTGW